MQKRSARLLLSVFILTLFALPAAASPEAPAAGPVSHDLQVTTYKDIPYIGQLLADGEDLLYVIVDQPKRGTVALEGDTFVYTPKAGKTGKDAFTYAAMDAAGTTSAPATVTVTVEKRRSQVTYSDMAGRSGYAAAIALAEEGIYVGRQLGAQRFFDPDAQVTRTEFLSMAMEAAGVLVDHAVSLTGFADDDAIPTWAKSYASAAAREGVIRGVSTQEGIAFLGENPITLQEAAAIMDRLLDVADVYLEDAASWSSQAMANMESVQVVSAGSFDQTGQPVTMVQAAEILTAAMELLESRRRASIFPW